MSVSTEIMSPSTTMEKHWVTDYTTSGTKKNEIEDVLILDTVKDEVKKRVIKLNQQETLFEATETEEAENQIDFRSIKISKDFLVSDPRKYFLKSQKWIGHVSEIKKDHFIAELKDLDDPTTYEIGEVDYDEISPEDKELIKIGAAFYWSLGYANTNGQIEKKSLIRFQRVNFWTMSDYNEVLDRADELYDKLKPED